jgi:hypothetical protein
VEFTVTPDPAQVGRQLATRCEAFFNVQFCDGFVRYRYPVLFIINWRVKRQKLGLVAQFFRLLEGINLPELV